MSKHKIGDHIRATGDEWEWSGVIFEVHEDENDSWYRGHKDNTGTVGLVFDSEIVEDDSANDDVNHPSHYTSYKGIEVIQLTEQMNFNRGNSVKYVARAGLKNPETEIQDLEKAKWYLEREIQRLKNLSV